MNYDLATELRGMGVNQEYAYRIAEALRNVIRKPGILKFKSKDKYQLVDGNQSGYKIHIEATTELVNKKDLKKVSISISDRNTYIYINGRTFIMNCLTDEGLVVCNMSGKEKKLKVALYKPDVISYIKKKAEERNPNDSKGKNFRIKKNYMKHHNLKGIANKIGLMPDEEKEINVSKTIENENYYAASNRVIFMLPRIISFKKEEKVNQPRALNSAIHRRYQQPMEVNQNMNSQKFEEDVRLENGIPQRRR